MATPETADPMTDHQRLVAALGPALARAHGLPGSAVQVLHTHISTLLLVGAHAYKLKRPVRLPFLDFSTLARRRHFCEEELRINRRTAPDLYLEVLPVTGPLNAPQMGGGGPVRDWALHMRRFPADALLQTLAGAGRLTPGHIDALAAHVAAFHLAQPPCPPDEAPAKTPWDWAADSLDEVAAHSSCPPEVDAGRQAALRQALAARAVLHAPWQAQRRQAGWVRDVHGDLHLGNLVAWEGRVLAFDAIEFDPALRRIDVVHDVAFTFMDLHAAGLPALAWRFINAYVEATGDHTGLAGLHAYAACRALVRAKVALLACQPEPTFLRYWTLAERLAGATTGPGAPAPAPAPAPRLVLTMGLSGSGKSTVAQRVLERLGAVRLRSDVERKRLHGLAPTERPADPASLYGAEATARTYARLQALAGELLAAGLNVVVDAALLRQAEREALRDLAGRAVADFLLLECTAPLAQMRERIARRGREGADPSDATLAVLDRQRAWAEPVPASWHPCHRVVRNDGCLAQLHIAVDRALGLGGGP